MTEWQLCSELSQLYHYRELSVVLVPEAPLSSAGIKRESEELFIYVHEETWNS